MIEFARFNALAIALALVSPRASLAADAPSPPPFSGQSAEPAVPEVVWNSMVDRDVVVVTAEKSIRGRLAGHDAHAVTLIAADGTLTVVSKWTVLEVQADVHLRAHEEDAASMSQGAMVEVTLASDFPVVLEASTSVDESHGLAASTSGEVAIGIAASTTWHVACVAPCSRDLPRHATYRVSGAGITPSKNFLLKTTDGRVNLRVRAGKLGIRIAGSVLLGMGLGAVVASPSVLILTDEVGPFVGALIPGLLLAAAGIPLVMRGRTQVHAQPGGRLARRTGLDPSRGISLSF